MRRVATSVAGALLALGLTSGAIAAEKDSCATVRMSDPGWMDITSTNAVANTILTPLGYTQKVENISVPIGYQALKNGQIDVFLGNWMPAQKHLVDPIMAEKSVELLAPNLQNAKFTLSVPNYVAEAGVKDMADVAKHADKFGQKIYGIEPGAPANQNIQKMIEKNEFGLKGWSLVESSESGMLSQVLRASRRNEWVLFLAWEPHPMNTKLPITCLTGADAYFGPNRGSTTVNTLARKGFSEDCPNLAKLFGQLKFSVDMENEIMGYIQDDKQEAKAAAAKYLKANPNVLEAWLAGVTTRDGKPALPAVRAALRLQPTG
jgi:glycine betaine/proline transport system substrate-binding protein